MQPSFTSLFFLCAQYRTGLMSLLNVLVSADAESRFKISTLFFRIESIAR
jgi:hypothetical protein